MLMRLVQSLEEHLTATSEEHEEGMATAELLGNAALGIAALVAIWAVLQSVGLDVMEWIRGQLQV